jgi:hypothetical protein
MPHSTLLPAAAAVGPCICECCAHTACTACTAHTACLYYQSSVENCIRAYGSRERAVCRGCAVEGMYMQHVVLRGTGSLLCLVPTGATRLVWYIFGPHNLCKPFMAALSASHG